MSTTAIDAQVRAGCVCGREVWLAAQKGGIVVYNAETHAFMGSPPIRGEEKWTEQVRGLAAVDGDVWLATLDGELLCVDAATRRMTRSIRLPGSEMKAALPCISFESASAGGTGVLAVASATGRVFLIDPVARALALTLNTFAPCTAVTQCLGSLIIAGDEDGALYAWDLASLAPPGDESAEAEGRAADTTSNSAAPPSAWTPRPTLLHQESKFRVRHLLFVAETGAVWVARENGSIDIYGLDFPRRRFTLVRRVEGVGHASAMVAVSGKIIVTTHERALVTVSAESATVLERRSNAHTSFIHAMVKVTRAESALLWSFGNDERVRQWSVAGFSRSAAPPRDRLHPRGQAWFAAVSTQGLAQRNERTGHVTELGRMQAADPAEVLRAVREEAQEMRLRLRAVEESTGARDAELAARVARVRELEEANARLTKDVTEITSKVSAVERERAMLQGDLSRAREELAVARADVSTRAGEGARRDEELSRGRTERLHLEQRLRDAESALAAIRAENARLCESMGSISAAQSAAKAVQDHILKSSAQGPGELQEARQLNRALAAMIASLQYTLRTREAEDRDLTALLNAFRRKVADQVSDPSIAALLLATMVRRAERFDLEGDENTKALLLERHGPFLQFVHGLQSSDPTAFECLLAHLQRCSTPAGEAGLSPESRQLLDRLVALTGQGGAVDEEALLSLARSIPATVSASTPTGGVGEAALYAAAAAGGGGGLGGVGGANGVADVLNPAAGLSALYAYPAAGGEPNTDEDPAAASLLRELRSQRAIEDSYVKEHRAMFEFILKTRRSLVDCLVQLQKRTVSAQQVVEALSANASAANASQSVTQLSPTKVGAKALPLQSAVLAIIRELVELTSSVVTQYLTSSEKQRLNVQHTGPPPYVTAMSKAGAEKPQQPGEVLIGGRLYDCTNFRHPGGSVITFFMGSGDATEEFEEFHIKLPRAHRLLKTLPSRPAPPDHSIDVHEQKRLAKLSADFKQLHDDCVREGLFDADWLHIIYRFADIILVHAVGLYLLFNCWSLWPVALIILGIAEGRCGWWMHEAGHYSVTGNKYIDVKIQEILYGFGDGMSAAWWRVNHNKHHATPQKHRHDSDLMTLPLVAYNKIIAKAGRRSPLVRRWISLQQYLFAPVTCSLVALFWQLYLHPRHILRTRRYTEAVAILCRWVAIGALCHQLHVSFWQGLFGVLFSQAFGAAYIFVSFSLNHTHLPVLSADKHAHFVEYASTYTMDVSSSTFVNWFMGYLNFQIEHHLFPCMPQFRFVKLSKRVRKLFEDNGLVYDSRPYMTILKIVFKNLGDVGQYILLDDVK